MAGSGRPAGAGRSGPRPMVAEGASVTGGRSPSGPLGIAESSASRSRTGPSACERTFTALPTCPATDVGHPSRCRAAPSGAVRAATRGRPSPPHEPDATDGHRPDPDRTDHRPRAAERDLPHARSLPGSDVTGGRPRTPDGAHRRGRRLALVATFSAGIGVGRPGRGRSAHRSDGDPNPAAGPSRRCRPSSGVIREAWDTIHQRVRRARRARRPASSSRAPSTA